jgi:hypothetical protein
MNMKKVRGTPSAWESGALGVNPDTVRIAGQEHEEALDAALGMKSISIRMPAGLVEMYKLIARHHGVGYQPLMRDILSRWVKSGLREVIDTMEAQAAQAAKRLEPIEQAELERKAA